MSASFPSQDGSSRVLELCYYELKLWDFITNQKCLISSNKTFACCWMHESSCVLTLEYRSDEDEEECFSGEGRWVARRESLQLCLRNAQPPDKPNEWVIIKSFNMDQLFGNLIKQDYSKVTLSPGHVKFGVKEDEQFVLISFQGYSIAPLIKITKTRNESFNSIGKMTKNNNIPVVANIRIIGELDLQWSTLPQNSVNYESDIIKAVWKMGDYDYEMNDISDDRLITSFHGTICIWSLKLTCHGSLFKKNKENSNNSSINSINNNNNGRKGIIEEEDIHVNFTVVEQLGHDEVLELIKQYNRKHELLQSFSKMGYIMTHLCCLSNQIFALIHDTNSVHVLHIDFMKYCFHSLTSLEGTVKLLLSRQIYKTSSTQQVKASNTTIIHHTRKDDHRDEIDDHFTALEVVQHRDGNSVQLIISTSLGNVLIYDMTSQQFLHQEEEDEDDDLNDDEDDVIKRIEKKSHQKVEDVITSDMKPLFPLLLKPVASCIGSDGVEPLPNYTHLNHTSTLRQRQDHQHHHFNKEGSSVIEYPMRELPLPYMIVDEIICLSNYKKVNPYLNSNKHRHQHHEHHLYTVLLSSSSSSLSSSSLVCSDSVRVMLLPSETLLGATYVHQSVGSIALSNTTNHPSSCLNMMASSYLTQQAAPNNARVIVATSSNHFDQIILLSLMDLTQKKSSPIPIATIDLSTSLSPLLHSHFAMLQLEDQYGNEMLNSSFSHSEGCIRISSMSFSPDGKYLACGDDIGDVRIYEFITNNNDNQTKHNLKHNQNSHHSSHRGVEVNLLHHTRTSTATTPASTDSGLNHQRTDNSYSPISSIQWSESSENKHLLISLRNGKVLLALKSRGYQGGYHLQETWDPLALRTLETYTREQCDISQPPLPSHEENGSFPIDNLLRNNLSHCFLAKTTSSSSSSLYSGIEDENLLYAFCSSMSYLDESLHCYISRHQILHQRHIQTTTVSPLLSRHHHHYHKSGGGQESGTREGIVNMMPINLKTRWQTSSSSNMVIFKLDSPCTGLTKHPFGPYFIATTLKGTVIIYHMFTKELRGVFSTKSGLMNDISITGGRAALQTSKPMLFQNCFRYPQVDPSGIYIAVGATFYIDNDYSSYIDIYQIFTGRRESRLSLIKGAIITSIEWSNSGQINASIFNHHEQHDDDDGDSNVDKGSGSSGADGDMEMGREWDLVIGTSNMGLKILKVPRELQSNMKHMKQQHLKSNSTLWTSTVNLYIPPLPKTPLDFRSLLVNQPSSTLKKKSDDKDDDEEGDDKK